MIFVNTVIGELCEKLGVDWDKSPLQMVRNELIGDNKYLFIAGGSLVRLLSGLPSTAGDIDIYRTAKDPTLYEEDPTLYEEFEQKIEKFVDKSHVSKFATLHKYKMGVKTFNINYVNLFGPKSVEGTLRTFDLEHCMFALRGDSLTYTQESFIGLMTKKQVLNTDSPNIRFRSTANRIIKYNRLGFDGNNAMEQLLKNYYRKDGEVEDDAKDSWAEDSSEKLSVVRLV